MSPVNVNTIGTYLREQGEQARTSIRHLAQAAGVSNPNLNQQIAKGLRISADALYVQAGILDEREGGTPVTEAIMADKEISDRQKQMLIDIYESFRKELRADAAARAGASTQAGDPPGQPGQAAHRNPPGARRLADQAADAADAAEEAEEAIEDAVRESHDDPFVEVVAAAEAEPWTEPPAPWTETPVRGAEPPTPQAEPPTPRAEPPTSRAEPPTRLAERPTRRASR